MGEGLTTPQEWHKNVCGPHQERMEKKLDRLDAAIRISNGKPCLLSRVDDLERTAAKPAPVPTISGRPNATKFKCGPLEITTTSAEVAGLLVKVAAVAVMILGAIYLRNLHREVRAMRSANPGVSAIVEP